MSRAVVALGSNLGEREQLLRSAVAALDARDGVEVRAASGIVETPALKPHGVDRDAPSYLNAVVIVETTLEPLELLDVLNEVEAEHGRERQQHWGDRTLDLDLIDFEGASIASERLTVPHPRAAERAFVLVPWLQADPDAVLPGRGRVADLLATVADDVIDSGAERLWVSS